MEECETGDADNGEINAKTIANKKKCVHLHI